MTKHIVKAISEFSQTISSLGDGHHKDGCFFDHPCIELGTEKPVVRHPVCGKWIYKEEFERILHARGITLIAHENNF